MGSQYGSLIMLVVLFAIMYFMMIRPQKKKEKEVQNMRNTLSQGDEVITIGGIHGKVVKVSDEIVVVELSHAKQRIEFSKWAIGSVVKKGKEKIEDKQEIVEEVDEDKE
ncbi:preprotein translocase subunit YajC [Sedimentibacter sp. MB31-C6]|uniref:preprotein translocase subunit YajC n=1 Tax=Sedimentibacter sp. MB31-C6 TaxID=3109366 RepID=UPI002DDCC474|nr:preprotein translocase subunit YajC [Sedimentibacter sp. MB36-C1]WSI04482.1 preprotein translocase subunit YajC [Sedimentibacter sp. MB36-C1]